MKTKRPRYKTVLAIVIPVAVLLLLAACVFIYYSRAITMFDNFTTVANSADLNGYTPPADYISEEDFLKLRYVDDVPGEYGGGFRMSTRHKIESISATGITFKTTFKMIGFESLFGEKEELVARTWVAQMVFENFRWRIVSVTVIADGK